MIRLPFALCSMLLACPSPERRDDVLTTAAPDTNTAAPDTTAPPTTTPPPTTSTTTTTSAAPDTTVAGPDAAAPEPVPNVDKARLIEEYKALALKNDCSKGYATLDGEWRFVGKTKTPNYSESMTIRGTQLSQKLSGEPDGKRVEATLGGEIRCVFKNRVLVQLDKVEPEGAYGNHAGDIYPCDLLGDMDDKVERILMICYFDWDLRTAAGLEYEYEKVTPKP